MNWNDEVGMALQWRTAGISHSRKQEREGCISIDLSPYIRIYGDEIRKRRWTSKWSFCHPHSISSSEGM